MKQDTLNDFEQMSTTGIDVSKNESLLPVIDIIKDNVIKSRHTILYGPPGTGKTHMILDVLRQLEVEGKVGQKKVIQFHSQYTYQDFIEGYRYEKGQFQYKEGVLLEFSKNITDGEIGVLFIDEINRADLSSVFGELLFLLDSGVDEKKEIMLPLSNSSYSLPNNLVIIGSMNSADKNISLIDLALRRRFEFIFIPPSVEILKKILSNKDIADDFCCREYTDFFRVINTRILVHPLLGKNLTLGSSMFVSKDKELNYNNITRNFNSAILPQIETYFGAENYSEIAKLLNTVIANNIRYGKRSSVDEVKKLINILANSDEELLF